MDPIYLHKRNYVLTVQRRKEFDLQVVVKESANKPAAPAQIEQLHNEVTFTKQLAGVPGVRPVLRMEGTESDPVLLLQYIEGQSLSAIIEESASPLEEKLRISVEIAGVLERIHAQQVIHRRINSDNILVAGDGAVAVIDFGHASSREQRVSPGLNFHDFSPGTLAAISPEQTGRISRPVDYRTDFYSLGVTLYELFTGQYPFLSTKPLELVHSHLAHNPDPPHKVDPKIPLHLSEIILKLLNKSADERYQTARGLQTDLQRCLEEYRTYGEIEPFDLAADDYTGRLQIPDKLYGRDDEFSQLLDAFERIVQGREEIFLIAGYAGIGKTALVEALRPNIAAKHGTFVQGKFDQYQRGTPYSAWSQAMSMLVDCWLAENATGIKEKKETLLQALGNNGQVLVDLVPNLEKLIGRQPPASKLGGMEAQNRFTYLWQQFFKVAATREAPLLILLDDLQWVDSASLTLIEAVLEDRDNGHLLIIGAYRENGRFSRTLV